MRSVLRASLCLGGLCAFSSAQGPETKQLLVVEDLIQRAVDRSRDLLALHQRIAEARGLQRQAGIKPVPTLELSASTGRPLATQGEEEYSAGYFYPLETDGKRQKRVRVADKEVQLAVAELAERVRHTAFEIQSRFADAVAEQRKLDATDQLIQAIRNAIRLTQARVDQGDVAPVERDLQAVESSRAEALRSSIAGRLQVALLDLRRLSALEAVEAVSPRNFPAVPTAAMAVPELERQALRIRPDLLIARLLEEEGSASLDLAEAEGKPNVTLSARFARRNSRFDDQSGLTSSGGRTPLRDRDHIVTLGVSIPLLNRNRNLGNMEAAAARQTGARLRRQHLEATIPIEVQAAWERYLAARRALELYNQGVVEQSERNLKVIRQAHTLGQLRLLDVLNEQRRVIDTQLAAIEAGAEEARALAELVRTVGGKLP